MPTCAMSTCKNTSRTQKNNTFRFYGFPKDKTLCRVWTEKCKRKDKFKPENSVVCSVHFSEEDFEADLMNRALNLKEIHRLKKGSIPSLYLPLQIEKKSDGHRNKRASDRHEKKIIREFTTKCADADEAEQGRTTSDDTDISGGPSSQILPNQSTQTDDDQLQAKLIVLQMKLAKSESEKRKLQQKTLRLKNRVKSYQRRYQNTKLKSVQTKLAKNLNSLFSSAQMKKLHGKRRVNWTSSDIAKALSVASMSKQAYETFRLSWKLPMPCPSTLRKWASAFKCDPGILTEVLELMAEEGKSLDNFKRLCVINFDEMKISSDVSHDPSSDTIIGPHKNAQVIVANGIFEKWRQPIYYKFDQKVTRTILFKIINELESRGFLVCAVVSDFGGTNRELWKELGVNSENSSFQNPEDQGRNIWMFADAPHMLKLLRNHLLDDGWVLKNGTLVDITIMEELLKFDSSEIKLCHKLTRETIDVRGAQRMKVSPAAKVFSNHTSTLSNFRFPSKPEISEFFRRIDNYFDVFNSRIPSDFDKPIRGGYGSCLEQQDKALDEVIDTVKSMRSRIFSKKLKKMVPRNSLLPCQHGILASIRSLRGLYSELKEKYNISYILTRRVNQDSLESLFSIIRSLGKTNDHPTPASFKNRMKTVLLGSKVRPPRGCNVICDDQNDHYYISAKLFEYVINSNKIVASSKPEAEMESDGESEEVCPESDIEGLEDRGSSVYTASLRYLAGYIAFVMRHKYNECHGTFTKNAADEGDTIDVAWTNKLSRGGLMIPSEALFLYVKDLDLTFCRYFPSKSIKNVAGITKKVLTLLLKKHGHIPYFIAKEFAKIRLKIRVKTMNKPSVKKIQGKRPPSDPCPKNVKKAKQFCK